MADLKEIRWNKHLEHLVNEEGEKFTGVRISEVVFLESDYDGRSSEFDSQESVRWKMLDDGKKREADAYEMVSKSCYDSAKGLEYCPPEWVTQISVIYYK